MNIPSRKTAVEVYYNTKEKLYPNGMSKITVCSKPIFKDKYYEEIGLPESEEKIEKPKNMNNDVRSDSVKRAKEKVFDIALLNEFQYFVTWTLDKEKIDRYSPQEVSKKLKIFLNNMQKRKDMKYLVIPEYHLDGAIHMHGLVSGNFKLEDSDKKTRNGQTIYNMPEWSWGFSTAIETYGENETVAKYITKYITKDFKKIFGSFYYAGGKIVRHAPTRLYDVDYIKVNAKEFSIPQANMAFKYLKVDGVLDGA